MQIQRELITEHIKNSHERFSICHTMYVSAFENRNNFFSVLQSKFINNFRIIVYICIVTNQLKTE